MTTFRIVFVLCICAALLGLAPLAAGAAPMAYGYVGLFADQEHLVCYVNNSSGFMPFTVYVWWLPWVPTDAGMQGAEYALQYPLNVIPSTVFANPGISESTGTLATGISVSFAECQTGWTWTHGQTCYLWNTDASVLQLVAHPATGVFKAVSCEEGNPPLPVMIFTQLCLNQICSCYDETPPGIFGVTIQGPSAIRVIFDQCVQESIPPQYFVLFDTANATDSIIVAAATRMAPNEYDLVLEEAMADSTTYLLRARTHAWSCHGYVSSPSDFEFTFFEAVATEETSWGAIKALFGN